MEDVGYLRLARDEDDVHRAVGEEAPIFSAGDRTGSDFAGVKPTSPLELYNGILASTYHATWQCVQTLPPAEGECYASKLNFEPKQNWLIVARSNAMESHHHAPIAPKSRRSVSGHPNQANIPLG